MTPSITQQYKTIIKTISSDASMTEEEKKELRASIYKLRTVLNGIPIKHVFTPAGIGENRLYYHLSSSYNLIISNDCPELRYEHYLSITYSHLCKPTYYIFSDTPLIRDEELDDLILITQTKDPLIPLSVLIIQHK